MIVFCVGWANENAFGLYGGEKGTAILEAALTSVSFPFVFPRQKEFHRVTIIRENWLRANYVIQMDNIYLLNQIENCRALCPGICNYFSNNEWCWHPVCIGLGKNTKPWDVLEVLTTLNVLKNLYHVYKADKESPQIHCYLFSFVPLLREGTHRLQSSSSQCAVIISFSLLNNFSTACELM